MQLAIRVVFNVAVPVLVTIFIILALKDKH
jgi:hypothetical protein